MTLATRAEPFTLEEFIAEVLAFVPRYVSQVADPAGDIPPILIVEHAGEIKAITWVYASPEYGEHFLDHMVPETLASYDASSVALVVQSSVTPRDSDGSAAKDPQEVILLSILAIPVGSTQEEALAAPIERRPDVPPQLGRFVPVAGGVPAGFARALYGGLGLDVKGGE